MPAYWRSFTRIGAPSILAVAACGFIAPGALAGSAGGLPNFMMSWDASGDSQGIFTYNPDNFATTQTQFGTWQLGGPAGDRTRTGWRYQGGLVGETWELTWDCVVNPNPFVDATINVTNNSLMSQTFWVYMPLSIMQIVPASLMSGSVSAVVTDANFSNGALLSATALDPVFRGYIDGVAQPNATLWGSGYNLAAPLFGTNSDTTSFTGQVGPAATMAEIAVALRFDLSPGDSATVTGTFDIQPIPGPAGLSLLAVFAAVGARRRRR
jgi:hypothetical protein